MISAAEYAEDIVDGPDLETDPGPDETEEEVAEAQRLQLLADAKLSAVSRDTRAQGDWNLRGDD